MENRIKELRVRKHISQEALGKELGVSQQLISRVEIETQTLPVDLLIKISEYFRVTTDYLLGLSDEKYNEKIKTVNTSIMEEHCDLIAMYQSLSRRDRKLVISMIETIKSLTVNEY